MSSQPLVEHSERRRRGTATVLPSFFPLLNTVVLYNPYQREKGFEGRWWWWW